MKDYNHEIKVLANLENRYANIACHGGYGNNPEVLMMSRTSTIVEGFIKRVDVQFLGQDENGEKQFERTLIIDSEYGHEIKLPYDKVIGMTILSSAEQAELELYNRKKQTWEEQIVQYKEFLNEKTNEGIISHIKDMIEATEMALERGKKLVEKGVKTYK